jgi:hypothetical protein
MEQLFSLSLSHRDTGFGRSHPTLPCRALLLARPFESVHQLSSFLVSTGRSVIGQALLSPLGLVLRDADAVGR